MKEKTFCECMEWIW